METQARVLEERFIKQPVVLATKPFAKKVQEALISCSYFDFETGRFIRTITTQGTNRLGPMGSPDSTTGYIRLRIVNCLLYNSHLVYLWLVGCLPRTNEQIDHIDGNRINDKPVNLRVVSHKLNGRNTKMHSNNSSGYTGVRKIDDNKYQSRITINNREKHLGYFNTPEEAFIVRQAWITAHPEYGYTTRHGL